MPPTVLPVNARLRVVDPPVLADVPVVLDHAAMVCGIRVADVELGAVVRELEREKVLVRSTLRDCGCEERVLLHAAISTAGIR